MCNTGKIGVEHLPRKIFEAVHEHQNHMYSEKLTEESETAIIHETLERNNGNKARTARELGIDRTTLWRKIKKYDIKTA